MINQKQLLNVEYFKHLVSLIEVMQDVHVKLNPGFSWQNWHLTRIRLFSSAKWA
jgi:hypothetical protein